MRPGSAPSLARTRVEPRPEITIVGKGRRVDGIILTERGRPMQRHTLHLLAAAGLVAGLGVGCGGPVAPPPTPKPFAGTALTVACPDPAFAKELPGRCAAWAAR